jgi:Flp pilus assembly protein TadD
MAAAVYLPVRHFDFVEVDDPLFVTENPHVAAGLTPASISWAFESAEGGNWMPLTWLSYMAEVQAAGGVSARVHHVTNLVLHAANAVLLFLVLFSMTGARSESAFVAALFAVHPLHVESVAWVAERKDVLSTFFWLATMWAYAAYARKPGWARYIPVVALFLLGLMSKPMVVTLPFALLLLDMWPLGRARWPARAPSGGGRGRGTGGLRGSVSWPALVREKLPLFVAAFAASVVTVLAQEHAGAASDLASAPLGLRASNALVSYVAYIGRMFWPAHLTFFYGFPTSVSPLRVAGAVAVLAAISVAVFRQRSSRPYLAVGWFWYLGTLVPVVGIVKVGLQGMADRYTYVPLIGLFIMVAWGASDLTARLRLPRRVLSVAGVLVLAVCAVAARAQVGYWKDNVALWTHTAEVSMGLKPFDAHMSLGVTLSDKKRFDEAIRHFRAAASLEPGSARAQLGLGRTLVMAGRLDEAIARLQQSVRLDPGLAEAHALLGMALSRKERTDEAIAQYAEALRLNPAQPEIENSIGTLLAGQRRFTEAIAHFEEAVRLRPDFAVAFVNLGTALAQTGAFDAARQAFTNALRIEPGNEMARRAIDELARQGGYF